MEWDISRQEQRMAEIVAELEPLLAQQTKFFKSLARGRQTEEEYRLYEKSRQRVRSLFEELERLRRAA
jgi:hypothetical protein